MKSAFVPREITTQHGRLIIFPDARSAGEGLAQRMARYVAGITSGRGRFTLALGAADPSSQLFLDPLARATSTSTIPWESIIIALTHDWCVPESAEFSGIGRLKQHLLQHLSRQPSAVLLPRWKPGADPEEAAATMETLLEREVLLTIDGKPHFDLAVLSLETAGRIAGVTLDSEAFHERNCMTAADWYGPDMLPGISLTLASLNAISEVWLLATGEERAPALADILRGNPTIPARHIRPSGGIPTWFVDEAAASIYL